MMTCILYSLLHVVVISCVAVVLVFSSWFPPCVPQINSVVFDKTGTLTTGVPEVSRIEVVDPSLNEYQVLAIAGTAESCSEHPIASAILKYAKKVCRNNFQPV